MFVPAAICAATGLMISRPWKVDDVVSRQYCGFSIETNVFTPCCFTSRSSTPLSGAMKICPFCSVCKQRILRAVPTPGSTTTRKMNPSGKKSTTTLQKQSGLRHVLRGNIMREVDDRAIITDGYDNAFHAGDVAILGAEIT